VDEDGSEGSDMSDMSRVSIDTSMSGISIATAVAIFIADFTNVAVGL